MSELRITTEDDRRWFEPGGAVSGEVSWTLTDDADAVELRLFWHTSGKGTEEAVLVDSVRLARPPRHGTKSFSFRLPERPYSFSGRLITLQWALELVVEPSNEVAGLDLVMGPRPVEVDISRLREI